MSRHQRFFAPALGLLALCAAAPAAAQIGMCTGNDTNPSSACFRLLCNSAVNGVGIRTDECQETCDLQTPTRWPDPFVSVTVESLSSSIDFVSTSDWNTVVATAFDSWNGVASSNLVLTNVGSNVGRGFGSDQSSHEVFWITDYNEFINKVGNGVNGALGVTVARYPNYGFCGDRDIFDADLVMNGVASAGFNWSGWADDCPANEWSCSNAQGTLIHELGHFVGLGHPCVDNSCEGWSIMAASSAPSYQGQFNPPENLRSSDIAAVEALYPGTPGGLGSQCGTCNGGLTCESIDGNSFCTQSCTNDNDCAPNLVCDTADLGLCVFPGSIEPGVGEACTNVGQQCDGGAGWCLGPAQGEGQCYPACNPSAPNCPGGEDCVAFQGTNTEGFCIGLAGPGEFCDNESVFCSEGLACIDGGCRSPCDPVTGGGCGTGQHCAYLWDTCDPGSSGAASNCYMGEQCPADNQFCANSSFCIPGGAGLEGASCDANNYLSCGAGKVCLSDGSGTAGTCFQRCDQNYTCAASQSCIDINDPNNPDQVFLSYCNPVLVNDPGGDGDGDGDAPGDGDGDGDAPGDGDGDGDAPGDGDGDGDAELEPPDGECNLARGHWDCPEEEGCVDDGDGDTFGTCSPDAEIGDLGAGRFCESDSECYGGLCVQGVCTRPCSIGCEANYECQEGVCVPLECSSDDVCASEYYCVESGLGEQICAKEQSSLLPCACVITPSGDADAGGPMVALALLGTLGLAVGRRRRR